MSLFHWSMLILYTQVPFAPWSFAHICSPPPGSAIHIHEFELRTRQNCTQIGIPMFRACHPALFPKPWVMCLLEPIVLLSSEKRSCMAVQTPTNIYTQSRESWEFQARARSQKKVCKSIFFKISSKPCNQPRWDSLQRGQRMADKIPIHLRANSLSRRDGPSVSALKRKHFHVKKIPV